MFDVIIVGSGAAGTFAAYGVQGLKVLVLDVGKVPKESSRFQGNLYDLKKNEVDLSELFIGSKFEGLHNISQPYMNPKVKSPLNQYIVEDSKELTPFQSENFEPLYSLAKGGMANGWGAGAYRFLDRELQDFPFQYRDLKPFYDELTRKIGINGRPDDLTDVLGETEDLLEPQPLPWMAKRLLRKYEKNKKFFGENGFKIGQLRQAVLTRDHDNRAQSAHDNLEFFKPYLPSVYNPAFTMNELIQEKKVEYLKGYFVESFEDTPNGVLVHAKNLDSGKKETFSARKLVLAAGVFNTAKIVMNSFKDFTTKLPLQENAISYIPFIDPLSIGRPVEKATPLSYLGLMRNSADSTDVRWCSIYGLGGPLRSEYLFDFPLSARANIAAAKYLSSAMVIIQSFYPGDPINQSSVQVQQSGHLKVDFFQRKLGEFERELISTFRRVGLFSHISLCKFPAPGNSFHYACTFPMKDKPGKYETDVNGKLSGTQNVIIADSSNFTSLPAINLTFTIMANALRISRKLKVSLV